MRSLKAPLKDYLRRRALARHGVRPELDVPVFAAGARSGVWVVASESLDADSVVYSVGVGDNLAWDLALVEHFGLTLHAFDPTPRSIAWVARQSLPERLHFHPVGLAAFDGVQGFRAPAKETSANFRPAEEGTGGADVEAPVRRFATLARELGHTRVDVLKIDVEGGEYALLPDVLASGPTVGQLLVEFHHDQAGRSLDDTLRAIELLRASGFRLLHVSRRGLELSFLRDGADCPS